MRRLAGIGRLKNYMDSKTSPTPRDGHLDAFRGLAALIVVLVHYLAAFHPYAIFGGNYQPQAWWEEIFIYPPFGMFVSGSFAVCLFFILSGYVLSQGYLGKAGRRLDVLANAVKRPIRLGGLVVFSVIIAAVLWSFGLLGNLSVAELSGSNAWFASFWQGDVNFKTLLVELLIAPFESGSRYNPPLWTIQLELYGSFLVYAFLLVFANSKYRMPVLMLLLACTLSSLFQGFILGMLLADAVRNYTVLQRLQALTKIKYALLITALYLSSYPAYLDPKDRLHTVYGWLPAADQYGGGYPMLGALLLLIYASTSPSLKTLLSARPLQFLGRISYGLYVVHFLTLGTLSCWIFLSAYPVLGHQQSFLLVVACGLPVNILFAYLLTLYIDEPVTKLASRFAEGFKLLVRSFPFRVGKPSAET